MAAVKPFCSWEKTRATTPGSISRTMAKNFLCKVGCPFRFVNFPHLTRAVVLVTKKGRIELTLIGCRSCPCLHFQFFGVQFSLSFSVNRFSMVRIYVSTTYRVRLVIYPFSSRIAFLIYTFLSPFSQTLCCWQFHCPLAPKNKHVLFGTKMIALLLGSMVFCIENAKQVELLRQYGYDLRVEKSWPVSLAGLLLCCMCNLSCEFLTQKLCLRHLNLVVDMLVITTLFGVMPLSCLVFWQKQQTVTFLTCLFLSLSNTRQTSQTNMICFLGSLRLILYLAFRSSGPKYPLKSTGNPFQFCLPTQNLGNPHFLPPGEFKELQPYGSGQTFLFLRKN